MPVYSFVTEKESFIPKVGMLVMFFSGPTTPIASPRMGTWLTRLDPRTMLVMFAA